MAHLISVDEAALENGFDLDTEEDMVSLVLTASVVPACCSDGCMVEPDGTCPHGFPSILLSMGMM
jgi:hypothetical protein